MLPTEDKYTQTRAEMIDTLAYALGGRAAEELVFHEPTTGAGNDIEKATALARAMVTQYGMSAKLGAVKYGTSDDEPFLGRNMGHERDYSDAVAAEIDAEVRGADRAGARRGLGDPGRVPGRPGQHRAGADGEGDPLHGRHGPDLRPGGRSARRWPRTTASASASRPTEPPVLTPAEKDALKAQAEADGAQASVGGGRAANNSDGTH